jgi:hypothetical protein
MLKVGGINTGWPMPYALLMKVPPFDMGRTPVRCVLLAVFALAFPAAAGLAWAREATRARFGAGAARAAVLLFLAWTLAEVYSPAPVTETYRPPAALARLVPGPVVNIPLSVFDGPRRLPADLPRPSHRHRLRLAADPGAAGPGPHARLSSCPGTRRPSCASSTASACATSSWARARRRRWRRLWPGGPVNVVDLRDEAPVH